MGTHHPDVRPDEDVVAKSAVEEDRHPQRAVHTHRSDRHVSERGVQDVFAMGGLAMKASGSSRRLPVCIPRSRPTCASRSRGDRSRRPAHGRVTPPAPSRCCVPIDAESSPFSRSGGRSNRSRLAFVAGAASTIPDPRPKPKCGDRRRIEQARGSHARGHHRHQPRKWQRGPSRQEAFSSSGSSRLLSSWTGPCTATRRSGCGERSLVEVPRIESSRVIGRVLVSPE